MKYQNEITKFDSSRGQKNQPDVIQEIISAEQVELQHHKLSSNLYNYITEIKLKF